MSFLRKTVRFPSTIFVDVKKIYNSRKLIFLIMLNLIFLLEYFSAKINSRQIFKRRTGFEKSLNFLILKTNSMQTLTFKGFFSPKMWMNELVKFIVFTSFCHSTDRCQRKALLQETFFAEGFSKLFFFWRGFKNFLWN